MFKRLLCCLCIVALAGCSDQKKFTYTEDGIKSLSPDILKVSLTEQAAQKGTYYVQLDIKDDPLTGGKTDWGTIAMTVHTIGEKLFDKQETVRIGFFFISPANNNAQWAEVFIRKDRLPANWKDLNYDQQFAYADVRPGNVQTTGWLCDYYKLFKDAQPDGKLPAYCTNY